MSHLPHRLASVLLVACTLVGLPGGGSAAERPRYGGAVVVAGRDAPAPSLDPLELEGALGGTLSRALYDTLYRFGPDQRAQPLLLAESTPDADFRVWDLTVKPGIKFHDGRPLTAADVVFTLRRFLASATSRGGCFAAGASTVGTVTESSRLKLRVELAAGCPTFAEALADPRAGVVPAAAPQPGASPAAVGGVGTGAFRLSSVGSGEWVLDANEASSAGRPFLDHATLRHVAVAGDVETALRIGAVDLAVGGHRSGDGGARFRAGGEDTVFLVLSQRAVPFDSAATRRAVSRAIDRQSIAKVMLRGRAQVARSALPESRAAYRALLDPWGAIPGGDLAGERRPALALGVSRDDSELVTVADRVQADLQEAGLVMRVVAVEEADGAAQVMSGQLAAWLTSRSFGDGATADLMARWLASLTPAAPRDAQEFAADASQARSLESALRGLLAAERALADYAVWIPLVHREVGAERGASIEVREVSSDGAVRLDGVWRRPSSVAGDR